MFQDNSGPLIPNIQFVCFGNVQFFSYIKLFFSLMTCSDAIFVLKLKLACFQKQIDEDSHAANDRKKGL